MFGGLSVTAPLFSPGMNSTHLKTARTTREKRGWAFHGLAGLPGHAGLTRFTAGAAIRPGKKPGKIYSWLLTAALYPLQCKFIRLPRKDNALSFYSPRMRKYSMGQKNGLHAFSYNSAQSEPIRMKSGTACTKYRGSAGLRWVLLQYGALADFGHDMRSSDSLRGSWIFLVTRITHYFRDFQLDKFYNIWTQQRRSVERWKLSEQNFENFTIRDRCSQKTQQLLRKIPGLTSSGRQMVPLWNV